jgi:hypothetical protein
MVCLTPDHQNSTQSDRDFRQSHGCSSYKTDKQKAYNVVQKANNIVQDDPNLQAFFTLFGKNNRWLPNGENIPQTLVLFANLIDLTYNYTSEAKYHVKHIEDTDLDAVRQNTPGFVAAHMFAEHLMHAKQLNYRDALNRIDTGNLSEIEWYVGLAFANATWRQAAVYRNRCAEGDWIRSFNSIFDENKLTLAKDKIQLRMCAHLLGMLIDTPLDQLSLPSINVTRVTPGEYGDERETIIDNFPKALRDYVLSLAPHVEQRKQDAATGGSAKLEKCSVKALREKAKLRNIRGFSTMNKSQLLDLLKSKKKK